MLPDSKAEVEIDLVLLLVAFDVVSPWMEIQEDGCFEVQYVLENAWEKNS